MPIYAAKATIWLQIESDYPDGMGEAQYEVAGLVDLIKNCDDAKVTIARVTDIEILAPKLREEPGLCDNKLFFGKECLDNGVR